MEIKDVLDELESSHLGLSSEEAARRLERHGRNELKEAKRQGLLSKFIDQFKEFLVLILIVSAVVSFFAGEPNDTIVIMAIVIINACLGIFQEYRAEAALKALKKMTSPLVRVIRDGKDTEIDAALLVPGDIVVIETGSQVPADARVIESASLKMDEAPFTGESIAVEKHAMRIKAATAVADRDNCVFAGTSAIWGRGKAVVVSTGMQTQLGKIAELVEESGEEQTPLQAKLELFGQQLGVIILGIAGIITLVGVLQGRPILEMFMIGVSLAVAAIPEGLPAVVTITLAIGMQKMAKQNAIVKKLSAVETLGCTSVICSDKTGTLTRNELTVTQMYTPGMPVNVSGIGYSPNGHFSHSGKRIDPKKYKDLSLLLEIGALNNDARHGRDAGAYKIYGDTTEGALLVCAMKAGIATDRMLEDRPRISEIPFDSVRKLMSTVHEQDGGLVSYVKGAPEVVLSHCTRIQDGGRVRQLTESDRDRIRKTYLEMAGHALRVIGFACKPLHPSTKAFDEAVCERGLTFIGLQGMIDPPRDEVKDAIETCKKAGIRVMMITGDHKLTAVAIGRQLGIIDDAGLSMSGEELDLISEEKLLRVVCEVSIFARVSPEHKLRIVRSLKQLGYVVAVTGDGVNDAPSLKEAQIGVAMGITGTDVAKEASEMILTDDNFSTIVHAVNEGRRIYDNIRKFVRYLLAANLSEVLIVLVATMLNLPLPLRPIQLLWINLVTDGIPALALGIEPSSVGVMSKKPRDPKEHILSSRLVSSIAVIGLAGMGVTLAAFLLELGESTVSRAQTMAFTTLVVFELFVAMSCRSDSHPLHKIGFFSNPWLLLSILMSLLLQAMVIYVPLLQEMFLVEALTLGEWGIAIVLSSIFFFVEETYKSLTSRREALNSRAG